MFRRLAIALTTCCLLSGRSLLTEAAQQALSVELTACCLLSGCGLLANNRSASKPPHDDAGARKWWEETPIPANLLPKVQARLAKEQSEEYARADLVTVEQCKNCTKQETWDA